MELNFDLEQIFNLAFQAFPEKAEYHAMRILISLPTELTILGVRGRNEYELDEPDTIIDNSEKTNLSRLISNLRLR